MSENTSRTRKIKLPFASVNDKPYIFASYGHDDKEVVFPLLKRLYESGYNVWYDEGITIGERYDEVIESHIRQSAVFLLLTSSLSVSRPYVTDIEIPIAYENKENAPIIPLFIENNVVVPEKTAELLPETYLETIEQVLDKLRELGIENFGEREAVPIEREVPLYWFDGHDLDPTGGTKNIVFSEEAPYACLAFHPNDLIACNPYAKELYFAGYNVRSCENCTDDERAEMIASEYCIAYVPFVTKKYIQSGKLESDYLLSRQSGKTLIALYIPTYDEEGRPEQIVLPSSIYEEFSHLQGLDLRELTNNDFLSKLETELETRKCYSSIKDGKVERRSFEIKDFLYDFTEDEKGIVLTKFRREIDNNLTNISIKKCYTGFPVVELGSRIFSGCNSIASVEIPNSITRIGNNAFEFCEYLVSITMDDSVTEIGSHAFFDCINLSKVILSKNLTNISVWSFTGCRSLTSITIPDSVVSVGDFSFFGCTNLVSVKFLGSETRIGEDTFVACSKVTVHCKKDSIVWKYCKQNGIKCVRTNVSIALIIYIIVLFTIASIIGVQLSGLFDLLSWLKGLFG